MLASEFNVCNFVFIEKNHWQALLKYENNTEVTCEWVYTNKAPVVQTARAFRCFLCTDILFMTNQYLFKL